MAGIKEKGARTGTPFLMVGITGFEPEVNKITKEIGLCIKKKLLCKLGSQWLPNWIEEDYEKRKDM